MARTLTSGQLAKLLCLSQSTVTRYALDGRIPFDTLPGGFRRFDVAEVRAALAGPPLALPDPDVLAKQVRDLVKQVALLTLRVEAYADVAKKREGA